MVRSCFREFDRYVHRVRRGYTALAILALVGGLVEAVVVVLVVRGALAMTDGAETAGSVPWRGEITVGATLSAAFVLSLAAIAVHVAVARLAGHLNSAIVGATRIRLVEAYRDSSWERQLAGREGDLQHAIGMLSVQAGGVAFGSANLVTNGLSLVALMVAALIVDPVATVVVIGFGGLVFVVIWPVRVVSGRLAGALVGRAAHISSAVNELDRLSLELRTAGVDRRRADDLIADIGASSALDRRMRVLSRLGNTLYKDLAIVFLVGLVWLLHTAGGSLGVEFGAVVLLVVRAVGNAQAVQNGLQMMNEHAPGFIEFGERVDRFTAAQETNGTAALDAVDDVVFEEVGFAYELGRPVLTDVSFSIGRGEAVGLVGPSGSGKTTLVHLLLRLRPPHHGAIRIGGTSIGDIAPADFAARVGFVPQEPRLIDGTIAENIRFYRDDISDEAVRAAARRAHLIDVIDALPDGFDTPVAGRSGLSGGQRQRLAIARALAGSPDLLVLDEPTSALDSESEQAIADTLAELRGVVTLLVIAHRPSTVERCHRLVHLGDGGVERITMSGAPSR